MNMMTGWLQNKEDWKGFARYEGLSKLFKMGFRDHIFTKVGKVRFQLFQGLAKMYIRQSLLSCIWLLKYYIIVKSTQLV